MNAGTIYITAPCPRCHGKGILRMCEVPGCPVSARSKGKNKRGRFCQFHDKIGNRGQFHPVQKRALEKASSSVTAPAGL